MQPKRTSRLTWVVLIVFVLIGFQAVTSDPPAREATVTTKRDSGPNNYAINLVGQRAVEGRLKDAESAKFRNQFVGKSGVPCGEVNSKNGFGAYNGFKRYMASGGGVSVIEGEIPYDQFEASWQRLCAK